MRSIIQLRPNASKTLNKFNPSTSRSGNRFPYTTVYKVAPNPALKPLIATAFSVPVYTAVYKSRKKKLKCYWLTTCLNSLYTTVYTTNVECGEINPARTGYRIRCIQHEKGDEWVEKERRGSRLEPCAARVAEFRTTWKRVSTRWAGFNASKMGNLGLLRGLPPRVELPLQLFDKVIFRRPGVERDDVLLD